jgi:outer membrane protein W
MQIASWLLVTSALVAPPPSHPATNAPVVRAEPATPAASFVAGQQRATSVAPVGSSTMAHRFGIGGSLAVSNYGIGGSTRYWFNKHVGVSMSAGWFRPRGYAYTTGYTTQVPRSSTVLATPSLMVMFNQTDPNRAVSLRPYVGIGVSYVHALGGATNPITGLAASTYSSTTPQEFGGTEMFFRDHPNLAISAEATYYRLPTAFVNRYYVNGLNFNVAAHFYLK